MAWRWLLAVSIGCLLTTSGFAEHPATAELSDEETMTLISGLSFPSGVEVAFEQSQLNPLFKSISKQQGVMLKSSEQGLVMRITHPRPEQRVLHEGAVSLTRQVRNKHTGGYRPVTRRMQLDPNRASHLVLIALEAFLQGDQTLLFKHFTVKAAHNPPAWRVQLEPLNNELNQQISRLWFQGEADQLQQFRSERDNGAGGYSHFLEVRLHTTSATAVDNPT